MNWQTAAIEKKRRIEQSVPKEWRITIDECAVSFMSVPQNSGILSSDELAITESTATELVKKLATGKLTSVAVTTAFCKRAALCHQTVNCALEFFPELAVARAKDLDDYYTKFQEPIGPLHGLPISLKDQCRIKGLETTMGYVAWIGKRETANSVLVDILFKAGAVFYIKTSVPQSLMLCETLNNIIGRTVSPRNKAWSPGGSSGGEGALIGFRGSVLGVGTDVGGSIRVPAAFNYLYGLRPSHGRLPYARMANSMEGQESIHSVCGPIGHSAADMRLFVTSVLSKQPWLYDSKVIPMPWRQEEEDAVKAKISSGRLNLGFYSCDGNVSPHPPILRGIKTVVEKLKEAGHAVSEWEPYKHPYAVALAEKTYDADGGADIRKVLEASGEPGIPNLSEFLDPAQPKLDLNGSWDANLAKWTYQQEYLAAIREFEEKCGKELDAIIAPVSATAAIRHNEFKYYGYANIVNFLDFTSVVVPVTFADKNIDVKNDDFTPMNDMDRLVQEEYDPEAYDRAPVAVQIIGKRLSEEKTLAIAEEVGKLLGNNVG